MKLINEAVKQKEKEEMKQMFAEHSIHGSNPNAKLEVESEDDDQVLATIDDESGKPVYIEYSFSDGEYQVLGMSWKKQGPFVNVEPHSGWSDFALGELEDKDPAAEPVDVHTAGDKFKLNHQPTFTKGTPQEIRDHHREEGENGNI